MIAKLHASKQHSVSIGDPSTIGACRRLAITLAEEHEFDPERTGRIGIIATEIATNIQRYAGAGTVLLQVLDDASGQYFEVLGLDQGPGMEDIDKCLRDGYSSGGTPGNGLGAVRRLSTLFDVFSVPGQGTVLLSRTADTAKPVGRDALEFGAVCVAVKGEIECGDRWCIATNAACVSMTIADGLGHGSFAAVASKAAVDSFALQPFERPDLLMTAMHRATSGTRGAAAACALLMRDESTVAYAGVGNICGAVVAEGRTRGMVSHNGTLGSQLLRTQQFEYAWPPHSYVVMHSDGLSARWQLGSYPGLNQRHPGVVAGVLYRDFHRPRDDASVLVVRYRS